MNISNNRRFIVVAFTAHLIFIFLVYAQAPDTLWTRTYGGIFYDVGNSVQQTSDSSYIIVGSTYSYSGNPMIPNVYLIKTDANGDTLWTKAYGGAGIANGDFVQQTTDKGYIIVGNTMAIGPDNWDIYLVKTDSSGDLLWTKSYGGDTTDGAYSVHQTVDQGYIVAAYTKSFGAGGSDVWLIKTDSLGDTLWSKTYGGSMNDYGRSGQPTFDQGYIITGHTSSFGVDLCDVYLVRADSMGDTLWTRRYGGTGLEIGNSVQQTSDSGYIIAGVAKSLGADDYDMYLIKTNTDGDTIWTKIYGGVLDDHGWSVRETNDNGYIVAGFTASFGAGGEDIWLLKTDANGDTLWTKTYGGSGYDLGLSVQQTFDGGYIIVGTKNGDVYLIKTAPDTFGIAENNIQKSRVLSLDISPNPFSKKTDIRFQTIDNSNVTIEIFDVTGCSVKNLLSPTVYPIVPTTISWDGRDNFCKRLPNGVYFLKFEAGDYCATKKLLLIR